MRTSRFVQAMIMTAPNVIPPLLNWHFAKLRHGKGKGITKHSLLEHLYCMTISYFCWTDVTANFLFILPFFWWILCLHICFQHSTGNLLAPQRRVDDFGKFTDELLADPVIDEKSKQSMASDRDNRVERWARVVDKTNHHRARWLVLNAYFFAFILGIQFYIYCIFLDYIFRYYYHYYWCYY